jgi:alcohol dehydrogenase
MVDKKDLPISLIGSGALGEGVKELKKHGFKKVLIVISETLSKRKSIGILKSELEKQGIDYFIFSRSNIKADLSIIEKGIDAVLENECDLILSFGGRDTTMCARGIAMSLKCYQEENQVRCYTNGEVPFASVVINSWINDDNGVYNYGDHKIKLSRSINPFMVIIDSELIRDLPRNAMAAVGIDSLTHSVEAVVSVGANNVSDACAFHAIKLLSDHLEKFIKGENSFEIREQITYANYLANMAFSNIRVNEKSRMRKDGFSSPAFDIENIDVKMIKVAETMGISIEGDEVKLGIADEIKRISQLIKVTPDMRKNEKVIYNI